MPNTPPPQNTDDQVKTNPYLDNPELNYELDKSRRLYEKLAMWYNLPEVKLEDIPLENVADEQYEEPQVTQQIQTQQQVPVTQNNFFSIPTKPQVVDYNYSLPIAMNTTSYRNNSNNARLTKLQASLIYGTLKMNLKTIGSPAQPVVSTQTGGSPETKFSETVSESKHDDETKSEIVIKTEVAEEHHEPQKLAPTPKPIEEKHANSISSFIGNFKVYGYSPSTGILNKLIKASNPQDAWKNFEPSSAKAWLYALTGRLLAIHDGK